MIDAGQVVAYMTLDRSNFSKGLMSALGELQSFSDSNIGADQKVQMFGRGLTTVGTTLTSTVTPALLGAGAATLKFSADYETSLAKVSTISDESQVSIKDMSKSITDLSNETGISATEIAENVYNAISAGQQTGDAVNFVTNSTKLAKAGFAEAGQSLDILTTILNAYGMEAEEVERVSDILVETQNKGKTTVGELASTMGKIIPTANAYGVNLEQIASGYAIMTAKGIATAETTTYMNGMLNELGKTGSTTDVALRELTGSSFKELMESGSTLGDVLNILNEHAENSGLSLADLFGSTEAAKAALVLANNEGKDFNEMLEQMGLSAGATDKAFEKVSDTTQERLAKSLNKLKNNAIELGDRLLPIANNMIESFTEIVDKFNKLDDETKDNIVSFGLFTAATGPVLLATGKVVTVVGQLMPLFNGLANLLGGGLIGGLASVLVPLTAVGAGFYVLHEAVDVTNNRITKSRDEMSLTERAISDFTNQITYTREELEEMGLVYKEFDEEISPEFRKAVEEMRLDIGDFRIALSEIKLDGVVAQEEVDSLISRFTGAIDEARQAVEEKKTEVQNTLGETFTVDDGVIDGAEQAIINLANKQYESYNKELDGMGEQVKELMRKVIEEGYTLTSEDENLITDYYMRIKQIELEALSNNQVEQLYARNLFKEQVATLDAEAAAELAQQKKTELDGLAQEEDAWYETRLQILQEQYQNANSEEKRFLDEEIQQLRDSHQEDLQARAKHYDEIYKALIESNENLKYEIDRFTLERFSEQDQDYNMQLNRYLEHNKNVGKATVTGQEFILEQTETSMTKVYTVVDENTGQMLGCFEAYQDGTGMVIQNLVGYNEEYMWKTQEMADEVQSQWTQTENKIESTGDVVVNANGEIQIATGEMAGKVVGHLQTIIDKNGNVITSIKDVNGNPVDISDNSIDVKNKINDLIGKVNALDGKKATVTFTTRNVSVYETQYQKSGASKYATGTENALSGIAEVAEYGPELIVGNDGIMTLALSRQQFLMQGGEKVYNAVESQKIMSKMSDSNNDISILEKSLKTLSDKFTKSIDDLIYKLADVKSKVELNIENFNNNRDIDIEALGEELAFVVTRKQGGKL